METNRGWIGYKYWGNEDGRPCCKEKAPYLPASGNAQLPQPAIPSPTELKAGSWVDSCETQQLVENDELYWFGAPQSLWDDFSILPDLLSWVSRDNHRSTQPSVSFCQTNHQGRPFEQSCHGTDLTGERQWKWRLKQAGEKNHNCPLERIAYRDIKQILLCCRCFLCWCFHPESLYSVI